MSDTNFEDTIDIEAVQAKIKELQAQHDEHNKAVTKVQEEVAEIQKRYDAATKLRLDLERQRNMVNAELRENEKALATALRLQAVREEQKNLRDQFLEKSRELDELTKTAHWREFAFDHQIEGGKRLALAKRGILGDKRGLGKTLSSLIYCDMVQAKKILVLAPNDVVPQFEDEIRDWAPHRTIFPLRGLPKGQRDLVYPMITMLDQYVLTLNYEAWRRDKTIIDDLIKAGIDTIICDEAHRVKASSKVTARGVFQIAYRPNYCSKCDKVDNFCGPWMNKNTGRLTDLYPTFAIRCQTCSEELSCTVKNVLSMTGTPILNKPQELFSMLFLVDRKKFPLEKYFLQDYCMQVQPNKWRFRPGGLERLTKFMSEFFLQRDRNDAGIHIPPPAITIHSLDKDTVKYHKQYEAERTINENAALLLQDGTRKDIFFILELILRARQCMVWPAGIKITDPETKEVLCHFDVLESQKLDAATELLEELCEEEERIIVFSKFKPPLYEMHKRIQKAGYTSVMATGDQTQQVKEAVRRDFDLKTAPKEPRWQVCFGTYDAFGTGVNLNAARHIIILDDEWSAGKEDQAIGRIDRLNSTDQANVHIFRVKDSIDDFMAGLIEWKRSLVDGFEESATQMEMLTNFFTKDN